MQMSILETHSAVAYKVIRKSWLETLLPPDFSWSLFPKEWEMPINFGISGRLTSGEVSGLGAYNVKRNSLMNGAIDMSTAPPSVRNANQGEGTIIRHREYLGDLLSGAGSPSAFAITNTYALNPGNTACFPWLSRIAQDFQEYEMRGCIFFLKTLSSDYTAALNMGSVFMAADYNASDPPPIDKMHLENMEFSSSCKPSTSLLMPVECDPRYDSNTHLYIASNNNYQNGDPKLYNLCNVYIGSQGVPNSGGNPTPIAEIWVTYEVALFKPIIPNVTLGADIGAHFQLGQCTPANPLLLSLVGQGTDPGFKLVNNRTIQLPNTIGASYFICFQWNSVVGSTGTYDNGDFGLVGCTLGLTAWNGNPAIANLFSTPSGHNAGGSAITISASRMTWTLILTTTNATASISLANVGDTWDFQTPGFGDVYITQWPEQVRT